MQFLLGLAVGLVMGWLAEWWIDWRFWRSDINRLISADERALAHAKQQVQMLTTEVKSLRSQLQAGQQL